MNQGKEAVPSYSGREQSLDSGWRGSLTLGRQLPWAKEFIWKLIINHYSRRLGEGAVLTGLIPGGVVWGLDHMYVEDM